MKERPVSCPVFAVHSARLAWLGGKKARNGCPLATIRAYFGGHFLPVVATDRLQRGPRKSMNQDSGMERRMQSEMDELE